MPIYETQLTMSTNNDSRQQATLEVPVVEYDAQHGEWLKDMRGWLIVLATLAASVTYSAGLNPPGGFWSGDKDDGGLPGNPVLHDGQFVNRFMTFYYFNATAFATSLVIVILLLNERFYTSEPKVAALTLTTVVDLISLVGAYIAGSTRNMPDSIYIIVLTCFLFACVVYFARCVSFSIGLVFTQGSTLARNILHIYIYIYVHVVIFFVPCAVHINEGSCPTCASSCCSWRRRCSGWRRKGACR
jgi:hypothetical protein